MEEEGRREKEEVQTKKVITLRFSICSLGGEMDLCAHTK